ncbi:MAG: phosphatase PAP2 family protein [Actinobacteria bacterium]|nr:phosphatase PAP2 family protein [Actinomycetota bacterium]
MPLSGPVRDRFTVKPLIAFSLIAAAVIIVGISQVEKWSWLCWVFLGVVLLDLRRDQLDVPLDRFLPRGLLVLLIPYLIYNYAPRFWEWVLGWQAANVNYILRWNDLFRSIPYNDAAIFRIYQASWLTYYMRWAYTYGFALVVWVPVIRSFFARDGRKALRYILSSHSLQLPIIIFFYNTILLEETWYVLGHPDGLARIIDPGDPMLWVRNAFPSMHTSVAFAAFLLSLREKGPIFKWVMGIYSLSVIFSTMYLEIHWILDVVGGIALGWVAVELCDYLMALPGRAWALALRRQLWAERLLGTERPPVAAEPPRGECQESGLAKGGS